MAAQRLICYFPFIISLQRMIVSFWFAICVYIAGCGALSFSETPVDTIVVTGRYTRLNCSFDNLNDDEPAWQKESPDQFPISIGDNVITPGYQLIAENGTGKYSIGICNASVAQDGLHRCEALVHPPVQARADLFVIEQWLDCTVNPSVIVKEQEEVIFTCSAVRGAPPGELVWQMNGEITSRQNNSSKIGWKYKFNKSENGAVIDCQMRHVTLPPPLPSCEEEIRIEVQYSPYVTIEDHSQYKVIEGDTYVANCTADANPSADVTWQYINGNVRVQDQQLFIDKAERSHHGNYTCKANNTFYDGDQGYGESTMLLDVQYGPSIVIRNGSEGVVVEGRKYEAFCDVDANPAAVVYWQHPSGDTTADATLLLDSVSRQQRGEYKCLANNTFWDNSTASSGESHSLDVQFPPAVAVTPEVPRKLGESVQLRCHAIDANPPDVDYTWFLANGDIFSNATVEIINITRDLHGDQSCTANNTYHDGTYGTGINVTFLDIQYPPSVNKSKIESKEKDTVVLTCHVDSNPYPWEFQWFYENVLLSSESTYTIDDVTRDDAGNYTCTVTTVFYDDTNATDQGTVYLGVQYLSSVNITILPSTINEGDDVDIHCQASDGNPDSHKIELIFKDETLATNDSQELHHEITDISPGRSGSYQCRAFTNFYDGTVNYSATKEELVVYYSARLIPSEETEFKIEIGEVVDINCTAHGMPVPSIKWFYVNDREISNEDDNFEIRNHQPIGNVVTSILSVTLADSTYYGEYVCEATNTDDVIGDRQSTTIIELVTDNGSDPLIAIITVSVFVLIILIVIIVAIVLNKKRQSKTQNGLSLDNLTYRSSGEEAVNVENQRREPDGTSHGDDINPYAETGTFSSLTSNSEKSAQKAESDSTDGSAAAANQQDEKNADDDENIDSLYTKPNKTKATGNIQEAAAVPKYSESSLNETGTLSSFQPQTLNSEKSAQKAESENTDGSSAAVAQQDNKKADVDDSLYAKPNQTKYTGNIQEAEAVPPNSKSPENETGTLSFFPPQTSNSEKSAQKAESDNTDGSSAAAAQQDNKKADGDDSLYAKPNKTKDTGNNQEAEAGPQYSESSPNETRTFSSFQPQTSNSEKSAQKAETDNTDGSAAAAVEQDNKNADNDNSSNETRTFSSFQPQTSNSETSAQKAEADNTDRSAAAAVQRDNKNADNDKNIVSLHAKPSQTKDTGNIQEAEAVPKHSGNSSNALGEALNGSQTFEKDVPGSISRGDDTSGVVTKQQDIDKPEISHVDLDFPDADEQIEQQQNLPTKDDTDYTTIRYV